MGSSNRENQRMYFRKVCHVHRKQLNNPSIKNWSLASTKDLGKYDANKDIEWSNQNMGVTC